MKLIRQEYVDKGLPKGWKPYYIYQIVVNNQMVGKVVLRKGTLEERYYDGHVGYSIDKQYRGHNYAYQAVMLLKKEALLLGFDKLIITCSPDNFASKKTILKLHAKYLQTVMIPKELRKDFDEDEIEKEVYLLELGR